MLAVVLISVGLLHASKQECWQLVGDVTCRVETAEKVVALSFDDGPTQQGVDAVLPELAKRNIRATFFLTGEGMDRAPGQAERLRAAGHELGNHSYSHVRMLGKSRAFYRDEIARTDRLLRAAGARPTLFRPPFGKRLVGLPLEVEAAGYRMVTGDVADDSIHFRDPRSYAADIVGRARPGSIILIHPMHRTNRVERAALPLVLDGLQRRGFRIVPVGELLALADEGRPS